MGTMQWESLFYPQRLGYDNREQTENGRSPFHKDHDRVVFSSAFRRLERKTQVHPLADNDHIHTRLTHSLEVGCVGRSLGCRVGELIQGSLPEWIYPMDIGSIVQSACLAHDIGNPPFGHTGENAIRHWFIMAEERGLMDGLTKEERMDFQCFEGNAQGLRILTQTEKYKFDGGLRLTYPTLGAFLKYPWTVDRANYESEKTVKYGCYQSERDMLVKIAGKLGLLQTGPNQWCRHPLVYLMEAADDICYGLIDLEDGVEMRIIKSSEIESLFVELVHDGVSPRFLTSIQHYSEQRRLSMLRGKLMDFLVDGVAEAFQKHLPQILAGQLEGDLVSHCDPKISTAIYRLKSFARDQIFNEPQKIQLEIGAYNTLGSILENLCGAAFERVCDLPTTYKNQRILDIFGANAPQCGWNLYDAYRCIVDYVSGMTDNYALQFAQQITGMRRPW